MSSVPFFLFLSTSITTKAWLVSIHHFFVFTYSDHENNALTTKGEIKYPGGSKRTTQNLYSALCLFHCLSVYLLSRFQQLTRYFLCLSIWSTIFFPQALSETGSINFPVNTTRHVKILHTYSLISHPLF